MGRYYLGVSDVVRCYRSTFVVVAEMVGLRDERSGVVWGVAGGGWRGYGESSLE